jgi:hypothetical protein
MALNMKAIGHFETQLNGRQKISTGIYMATTAKRKSLVIPEGVSVYDTGIKQWYAGDGETAGGVKIDKRKSVRTVAVAAAASGATIDSGTSVFTWADAAGLRTGDAITIATGTGATPSGFAAGTYYLVKENDDAPETNTGTTFKLATTRANALARTTGVALAPSGDGTAGWTAVFANVVAQTGDDLIVVDPVSAAVGVVLPDADSNDGFSVTVRRARTATNAVNIKELDDSGNIAAAITLDDSGQASFALKAATNDWVTVVANGTTGEYWSTSRQITP